MLTAYVAEGHRPSRRREVTASTSAGLTRVLPEAQRLAGTYAEGRGPNCFGTVMAAAGVPGPTRNG